MPDTFPEPPLSTSARGTTFHTHRHTNWVYTVSWLSVGNPKRARIASAGRDNAVQHWRAWDGLLPAIYRKHHTNRVNSVAWSPDGRYLASASKDGTIRVYEVALSKEICCFSEHKKAVKTVAWSPDGQYLASGGDDAVVRIWKLTTKGKKVSGSYESSFEGHEKGRWYDSSSINAVAWSPDGKSLASASDDKTVRVWKAFSSEEILCYKEHRGRVYTISWSPDGTLIASAGDDKSVHIWEATNGDQRQVIESAKRPMLFASANGSDRIDNQARILVETDDSGNVEVQSPPKPLYFDIVTSVAWSPDGQKLALASQKVVHIFACTFDGAQDRIDHIYTYKEHSEWVRTLAWSSDGHCIASGGDDKCVKVWKATEPDADPDPDIAEE